jgi:hypothetical protein
MGAKSSWCPRCEVGDHGIRARKDGLAHRPTTAEPTIETLMAWEIDGVGEATDGCRVEPDGRCPHGHPAWMLVVGLL